jgi:hypothetical protein
LKHPKIAQSALIGILATCAGEALSLLLKLAGFGEHDIFQIDSTVIINNQYNFFLGFIASIIMGSVLGMLFYLAEEWLGYRYFIIGGIAIALYFWFAMKIYSSAFIIGRTLEQRPLLSYYNHIVSTLFAGLCLGLFMKRLLRAKMAGT